LVAFPTETVYGLGADAFNTAALARIFEVKGRPRFDPLIIHIAGRESLDRAADRSAMTAAARHKLDTLSGRLWPGPLTLILPKRREVPDLATAGLASAAIRFPDHPAALRLIRLSTGIIAAPSANLFGRLSPTRAEHVRDQLGDRIDFILDGGAARVGVESTVLDLVCEPPRILRYGGTTRERIEELIGPVEAPADAAAGNTAGIPAGTTAVSGPAARDGLRSPGQLTGHYAPRTPLSVHPREELAALSYDPAEAYLFFDGPSRDAWLQARPSVRNGSAGGEPPEPEPEGSLRASRPAEDPRVGVLSESGDMIEAAARFFSLLHILDSLGVSRIRAEQVPPGGLGSAINDRLFRASKR
jgi:L-threonylcarbamoyladenylate synthase